MLTFLMSPSYLSLGEGHRGNVGILHLIQGANNLFQSLPVQLFIFNPHLEGNIGD